MLIQKQFGIEIRAFTYECYKKLSFCYCMGLWGHFCADQEPIRMVKKNL